NPLNFSTCGKSSGLLTPRLKMVTACPSAINASTTAGPRKSVPPKTRTFFGVRANTFDVPATKRPKDDAADVRINRLRFITGCDLHLDISTSQPLNHVISATAGIADPRMNARAKRRTPLVVLKQRARADE